MWGPAHEPELLEWRPSVKFNHTPCSHNPLAPGRKQALRTQLYTLQWRSDHTLQTFRAEMCKHVAALYADPDDREPLSQILLAVRRALLAELKPYAAPDFDASDHVSWPFSFTDNLISLGFKEHQTLPNILKHDDHTPPAQIAAAARINPHTANPKHRHKAGNMVNPDGCRHCEQR